MAGWFVFGAGGVLLVFWVLAGAFPKARRGRVFMVQFTIIRITILVITWLS
jgi:hypothetical protein